MFCFSLLYFSKAVTDSDWNIFHLFPTQESWINFTLTKSRKWKEKKKNRGTRIPQDDQNKRKYAHEEKRHSPVATKWKSFNHETTCKIHFERQLNNPIELRSGFTEQNYQKWKMFANRNQGSQTLLKSFQNLFRTCIWLWQTRATWEKREFISGIVHERKSQLRMTAQTSDAHSSQETTEPNASNHGALLSPSWEMPLAAGGRTERGGA